MGFSKSMAKMSDGLEEINRAEADQVLSTSRGANIKESISSAYDKAAEIWDQGDVWNWGMYDADILREIESLIPEFAQFNTDGFSEQLYFYVLRRVPIELAEYSGKKVLEVGSGLGAGLNFLSRCVPGASLTGVDLSSVAVRRANSQFARAGSLRFLEGDAEKLPFEDGAFDVIINVESSHNYPDLARFLSEVERVLKPGGVFSLVDCFSEQRRQQLDSLKSMTPNLEWSTEQEVSAQVKASIQRRMSADSYMRKVMADKRMPSVHRVIALHSWMTIFGAQFAGYRDDGVVARVSRKLGALTLMEDVPIVAYSHHVATRLC